eukprot:5300452-Amphidinium_carterae.1
MVGKLHKHNGVVLTFWELAGPVLNANLDRSFRIMESLVATHQLSTQDTSFTHWLCGEVGGYWRVRRAFSRPLSLHD